MMQDTHFSFLISFSVTSMSMWTLMPIFCFNLNFILISYSGTSFFISIFYSITLFNSMFVLCRGSNVYTHANILSNFYIIFNLIFHYFILYFYFSIQKLYFFYFCTVLTTAMLTLMPIFWFNFDFIFDFIFITTFSICIFFSITLTAMSKLVLPRWPPQPCRQRAQRRRGPKIANFCRTEGCRTKKRGRILPGF